MKKSFLSVLMYTITSTFCSVLGSAYESKEASLKILKQQFSLLANKTIIVAPTKYFIMYDDPLWFREQVKNFLINGLKN